MRLYLVESLLLALAGGLVGLQLAYWLGDALIRALPFETAAVTLSAAPDWRVGLFTLGLSVAERRRLWPGAGAAREPGGSGSRS